MTETNRTGAPRIAFLTANEGVEQVELTEPLGRRGGGRRSTGADRT